MNESSRRDFLKGGSLLAGSLLATGTVNTVTAAEKKSAITWADTFDVIVVGSGMAATVAATTAAKKGTRTVMLEKMAIPGGSSAISNATLAVAGSDLQEKQGIKDDWQAFFQDMEKRSNGLNNPELHEIIAKRSVDVYNFLKGEGAKFDDTLSIIGGQSIPRVLSPKTNGEIGILLPLRTQFLNKYKGTLMTRCKVDEVVFDEQGTAIGVKVRTNYRFNPRLYSDDLENKGGDVKYFRARKGIICGTGGYVNDKILRGREFPKYKALVSSQQIGATMSGFKLLQSAGAYMVHTSLVQHSLPLGAILSSKGFMVDPRTGKRFVNELGDDGFGLGRGAGSARYNVNVPDFVSKFLKTSNGAYPIAIFDKTVADTYEDPAQFPRNIGAGYVVEAPSIEELAKKINLDPRTLRETTDRYNQMIKNGKDEDFGKDLQGIGATSIEKGPFYAYYVFPHLNYCLGGAYINKKAQVIRNYSEDQPIKGLYAAGEATGGVHGAGRISGTSIADCCVFGMVAAENAVQG